MIEGVSKIVSEILANIKSRGDEAIKDDIKRFDKWEISEDKPLEISKDEMKKAYENIDNNLKKALQLAYDRIEAYHKN